MDFDFEGELYRVLAGAKEEKECPESIITTLIDIAVNIASSELNDKYCLSCFMSLHLHESISHQTSYSCQRPSEEFKKEMANFRGRLCTIEERNKK